MKTWLALPVLFFTLAQSPAADPLATLTELRTALREELKSTLDKGNFENNQRLFQLESLLVENLPDKELPDERMAQTIQALLQVRAISRDKKVSELSEKLVDELRTQSRAAAKRLQENFDATLAKCLRGGFNAAKPSELDAPLKEIAGLKRQLAAMQYRNSDVQMAYNSQGLQTVEGLLNAYQDLLFAAEKGTAATNSAQRLSGDYSYREMTDIIPRSEFLELMNSAMDRLPMKGRASIPPGPEDVERQVAAIIADVKKLDDLEGAVKQVDDLMARQRKAGGHPTEPATVAELKNLRHFHREIISGMATTLDSTLTSSRSKDGNIMALRNMLFRFAVPRLLGLVEDKGMKDDESLAVFLHRTVTDATEKQDWKLLGRALNLSQRMSFGQSTLSMSDSSALQQFLAAQNQERARQYAAAVVSYLAALKTGSQSLPAEFIGDRLAAIEKEHPKDYQAGMELTNNPSSTRNTATSGASKTVFSASGEPASQISVSSGPVRVLPRPTPNPNSVLPKTGTTPEHDIKRSDLPSQKPAEPQSAEKKPDLKKQ